MMVRIKPLAFMLCTYALMATYPLPCTAPDAYKASSSNEEDDNKSQEKDDEVQLRQRKFAAFWVGAGLTLGAVILLALSKPWQESTDTDDDLSRGAPLPPIQPTQPPLPQEDQSVTTHNVPPLQSLTDDPCPAFKEDASYFPTHLEMMGWDIRYAMAPYQQFKMYDYVFATLSKDDHAQLVRFHDALFNKLIGISYSTIEKNNLPYLHKLVAKGAITLSSVEESYKKSAQIVASHRKYGQLSPMQSYQSAVAVLIQNYNNPAEETIDIVARMLFQDQNTKQTYYDNYNMVIAEVLQIVEQLKTRPGFSSQNEIALQPTLATLNSFGTLTSKDPWLNKVPLHLLVPFQERRAFFEPSLSPQECKRLASLITLGRYNSSTLREFFTLDRSSKEYFILDIRFHIEQACRDNVGNHEAAVAKIKTLFHRSQNRLQQYTLRPISVICDSMQDFSIAEPLEQDYLSCLMMSLSTYIQAYLEEKIIYEHDVDNLQEFEQGLTFIQKYCRAPLLLPEIRESLRTTINTALTSQKDNAKKARLQKALDIITSPL